MSEEITASYVFNADTLLHAFGWHQRRKLGVRVGAMVLGYSIWLVAVWNSLSKKELPAWFYLVVLVSVTLLGFAFWWAIQKTNQFFYKRRIRAIPSHGKEVKWIASGDSFKCLLSGGDSTTSWDLVFESVQTPEGALVYPQKNFFYWLPKTAFVSEADYTRFVDILAAKTKHTKLG
jgi:hypothetical protein